MAKNNTKKQPTHFNSQRRKDRDRVNQLQVQNFHLLGETLFKQRRYLPNSKHTQI